MSQQTTDNMHSIDDTPDWPVAFLAIAAGFLAALQLGKVPPALSALALSFDASRPGLGWIASMLAFVGALSAIAFGLLAQRFNPRRMITCALIATGIGCILGAGSTSIGGMLTSRVLEGLGLVSIAVAAPRMVVNHAGKDRVFALGVWSCYVPVGMGLGVVLTVALLQVTDWRGAWLWHGAFVAAFLLLFLFGTRHARTPHDVMQANWRAPLLRPASWCLGFVFACYALNWMALMTWLPDFATSRLELGAVGASLLTAVIVSVNAIGNLVGAWLIRAGASRLRLLIVGLGAMAVTGPALMWAEPSPLLAFFLLVSFSGVAGVMPPTVFGTTALIARDASEVPPVNGVIVQLSQVGQLIGAPLLGWLVAQTGDYLVAGWVFVVSAALGMLSARVATLSLRDSSASAR